MRLLAPAQTDQANWYHATTIAGFRSEAEIRAAPPRDVYSYLRFAEVEKDDRKRALLSGHQMAEALLHIGRLNLSATLAGILSNLV